MRWAVLVGKKKNLYRILQSSLFFSQNKRTLMPQIQSKSVISSDFSYPLTIFDHFRILSVLSFRIAEYALLISTQNRLILIQF